VTRDSPRPPIPDDVPGVRVHASADPHAGPRLAILGAVHGDEPAGLAAIDHLDREIASGRLRLDRGELVLVHGNPAATMEGRRHTEGGTDLNRLFDFRFLEERRESSWTPEHRRAVALRPVLEACEAMLDLHSAGSPTPPFAIADAGPAAFELAAALDVDFAIVRWTGEGAITERTTLGTFRRLRRPALVVECGGHLDDGTAARATETALRALEVFGLAGGTVAAGPGAAPASRSRPAPVEVYGAARKPDPGFRFTRAYRGFDPLRAGELVGRSPDSGVELQAPEDGFIVLPNDRVGVGEDVAYFARPAAVAARAPSVDE
jgi:predicted deacylase